MNNENIARLGCIFIFIMACTITNPIMTSDSTQRSIATITTNIENRKVTENGTIYYCQGVPTIPGAIIFGSEPCMSNSKKEINEIISYYQNTLLKEGWNNIVVTKENESRTVITAQKSGQQVIITVFKISGGYTIMIGVRPD
jgi:hypothetical protein